MTGFGEAPWEPPTGGTSAELLLEVSVEPVTELSPAMPLSLLEGSAPACLSSGQVQKEQQVKEARPNQEEKPPSFQSVPPEPSTDRA